MNFACDWCEKKLSSQQKLDKHKYENKVPCNLKCRDCDLKLVSKYLYKKHAKDCQYTKRPYPIATATQLNLQQTNGGARKRKSTQTNIGAVLKRNKAETTCGYFYILHTRRNQLLNENIYKVGRTTKTLAERLNGYEKHGKYLFTIFVEDCYDVEEMIKRKFNEEFEPQTREYGARCEYYRGDIKDMTMCAMKMLMNEEP